MKKGSFMLNLVIALLFLSMIFIPLYFSVSVARQQPYPAPDQTDSEEMVVMDIKGNSLTGNSISIDMETIVNVSAAFAVSGGTVAIPADDGNSSSAAY